MKTRASTALAVAAVALLLACSWWWLRAKRATPDSAAREATPTEPIDAQATSLEPGGAVGDSADGGSDAPGLAVASRQEVRTPAATQLRLRVRSSLGFWLECVEIRGSGALWQPHKLVHGVATLSGIALPLEARAPGHAARCFDALGAAVDGAYELLLEPESLVVIDDPNRWLPGQLTPSASDDAPLRDLAALCSQGRIDERRHGLAFDSERLGARRLHELELGFEKRDAGTLRCKVRIERGLRAHGEMPANIEPRLPAPLVVRVHPEARRGGPWLLRIVLVDTASGTWLRADANDRVVGRLHVATSPYDASGVQADGQWTFDAAPTGRDYSYALFDLATGASAIGTLRHLGEPIELRLKPGCVVAGRVAVPEGSALPASIDLTVQWSEPPSRVNWRGARSMWNTQTREDVPVAHNGSFELACFDAIPDGYDGRGLLSVQVDSDDFASGGRELEVARAARHELGVIELAAAAPGITVAWDAHLWPRSHFRTWLSAAGSTQDVIRIIERPGGSWLVRAAEAVDAPAVALWWITESRERDWLFLERDGDVYRAARLEERPVEVAIEPGQDPDRFWRLALCWRDARVDLDEVRATQGGEVLPRSYRVPSGARLSWTPFRQLNAGVSPPLGPPQSVELDPPIGAPTPRALLR